MRVSAVQYHLHTIRSFDEFAAQVTHYVKTAQEFDAEFVLFPEFFTTQLLSIPLDDGRQATIDDLANYTEKYTELFVSLAKDTGMYLIGGTHVIRENGKLYNVAHLFAPDGTIHRQAKLHITPTEANEWNIAPGDRLHVFETDKATIAILTCYDIEFPEIVRLARAKGADVIFCPSCTDDRHGFYRVRYCCHARAVENEVYVVTTGTVGSLPTVDFMRANFGQAAVITPNDIPFPQGGVLAAGEINSDMAITADLDLSLLRKVREKGSVATWRDRRTDLYPDWNTMA
ncbi:MULTISPECIES: carbon-nitrogen hydrolase family protein [Geobacillus]|uniref:Acyltransferase n=1 Tax=Geobacillus thermocatenulatus TaxID=33938 RepID=A0A226QAD8_9BACL|nr:MULTISPECIES: carbon-nitrogen hydrolase family protein [Geobacillus]ASS97882.1 acyltransferase [Geobacillus thermocatenulatus]KLR74726.1 acyltransferase [Geobacillus sp. T6]OXB88627.1 acyltransferase [Geobacillus thermocatenulatus]RAN31185.1 acyltransferase [Geobacillus sp. A8]